MTDTTIVLGQDLLVSLLSLGMLALLTYAGLKDHRFMVITGLAWVFISIIFFVPLSNPLGMLGTGTGLVLSLWGAYWLW